MRILDGRVTDIMEAKALMFKKDYIDVYSASWGPRDNGATMEGPSKYTKHALEEGARTVSIIVLSHCLIAWKNGHISL